MQSFYQHLSLRIKNVDEKEFVRSFEKEISSLETIFEVKKF